MKSFTRHLLLFSMPFIAWLIWLFIRPLDKQFAFRFVRDDCSARSEWEYQKIFSGNSDIDVAFIGSSRTWHAVMDSMIEKKWSETQKDSLHFLNLGYCRFGRNFHYELIKDLLEREKVKVIVLEITSEEDHYSHIDFGYIADAEDLFLAPILFNKDYLRDLFNGFRVRFEWFRSLVLNGNKVTIKNFDSFGYAHASSVLDEKKSGELLAGITQNEKLKTGFQEFFYLNYPRQYLKKIRELTLDNHVQLFFLYLPQFNSTNQNLYYKNDFGDEKKIIFPPDAIYRNRAFWVDEAHLNDRGARLFSEKIVDELSEEMNR